MSELWFLGACSVLWHQGPTPHLWSFLCYLGSYDDLLLQVLVTALPIWLPLGGYWLCHKIPCWGDTQDHVRRPRQEPKKIRKRWKRRRWLKEREDRNARFDQWAKEYAANDGWAETSAEEEFALSRAYFHKVVHACGYAHLFDDYMAEHPDAQLSVSLYETPSASETDALWKDFKRRTPHLQGYGAQYMELIEAVPDLDTVLGLGTHLLNTETIAEDLYVTEEAYLTPEQCDYDAYGAYMEFRTTATYAALTCMSTLNEDLPTVKSVYVAREDRADVSIVVDSGASVSITSSLDDFDGPLRPANTSLLGLTESVVNVAGIGTIRWTVRDDNGQQHVIKTKGYYIPSSRVRLFSPQCYFTSEQNAGEFAINKFGNQWVFANGGRLTFRCDGRSNLPIVQAAQSGMEAVAFLGETAEWNENLTDAQKEVLRWHVRLGHFHIQWIQSLMRNRFANAPIIRTVNTRACSCKVPLCASCLSAKQHRRGREGTVERKVKEMAIKAENLMPGECVSVDQYESRILGRRIHTKGKEHLSKKLKGGTIFVDHASGAIFVHHQVTLGALSTVESKRTFERNGATCGVRVKRYRGDNGVFKSKEFIKELDERAQSIDFSGVGAKHQNGVSERNIRTVVESARTMLLHAATRWPECADMSLWPFALDYACHLFNHMPNRETGVAPMEIYCGSKLDPRVLRSARTWGCPAYVLDPKLQDGGKIPKWKPRSKRGQFLGFSKVHSSSIGIIRNLETGSITPQFHVVYDDFFETIANKTNRSTTDSEWEEIWKELYQSPARERYLPDWEENDLDAPPLTEEWLDPGETVERRAAIQKQGERRSARRVKDAVRWNDEIIDVDAQPDREVIREIKQEPMDDLSGEAMDVMVDEDPSGSADYSHDGDAFVDAMDESAEQEAGELVQNPPELRRSTRIRRPPKHTYGGRGAVLCEDRGWVNYCESVGPNDVFLAELDWTGSVDDTRLYRQLCLLMVDDDEGMLEEFHPLALVAKASSADTPSVREALRGPDAENFKIAMKKEIQSLADKRAFKTVARTIATKAGANILGSMWALKRKRFPDGSIRSYKARWCPRGDQQIEGVDFFETYAPVVSWVTVRLMLVLSIELGMYARQVDYTLAFVHADLEEDIYCEMPQGFSQPGSILLLKKSVYGLRQSPINWFNLLSKGLKKRGFKQCPFDSGLFISPTVICVCYVDDCLFFSRTEGEIEKAVDSLDRKKGGDFDLGYEDIDVAGYLGIEMKKHADGSLELRQTGLIDRIINVLGLENGKPKDTPAEFGALPKDADGEPAKESWEYASVVGMMMYLTGNTRADCAFAVNQCARFIHDPKASHEVAVKRIGRYLLGTRDRGMVIAPSKGNRLKLDLHVDADFAGLYSREDDQDPTSVKSRSGYVFTLGDVPVLWGSKLQSEIALSTLEAEYIAMSQAMRELVHLRRLMEALSESLHLERDSETLISTVWEDNQGCISLAKKEAPLMTPRTKHIAIKYHWFRSMIGKDRGIIIDYVVSAKQKADIFTKGLKTLDFETKRKLLMGW